MRSGFRQWFAERAELIVLGLTMLTTASLVIWSGRTFRVSTRSYRKTGRSLSWARRSSMNGSVARR